VNDTRVLMERDGSTGIARVTLNNPERRNSYDPQMREQLGAHLDELAADDAVKVVLLRGAEGVFSTGADMANAYSWYEQGTRFLDISNPAKPIQIGYWRPDSAVSWAPYWHKNSVFIADISRGVEIVSLEKGAYEAQESGTNVTLTTQYSKELARESGRDRVPLAPNPFYGWACPMVASRDDSADCGAGACC